MNETPNEVLGKSMMPSWIKCPQDFIGGLVLIAVSLFTLWASNDLQGMHGHSLGPGAGPRMFSVLLLVLGGAIAITSLLTHGPSIQKYAWRGPFFIAIAIVTFALTIRPLGLVVASFGSFVIASLGTPEMRWKETIAVGIGITTGCGLLFPYVLGLPLQLFPRILLQ